MRHEVGEAWDVHASNTREQPFRVAPSTDSWVRELRVATRLEHRYLGEGVSLSCVAEPERSAWFAAEGELG